MPAQSPGTDELFEHNRRFYDSLWSRSELVPPERFNTWPRVRELAAECESRLEVGAGMRPRLPLEGSAFADISQPALACLRAAGGRACRARVSNLPFADGSFELVAALDILEHVRDDYRALAELSRVLHPQGRLMLSFPMHAANWTRFDALVGHYRRYEPERVHCLLDNFGLQIEECAVYGMKPKSSRLVTLGMNMLERMPQHAMWWYNRVFMPIGMRMQKPLDFAPKLIEDPEVGEVILIASRG